VLLIEVVVDKFLGKVGNIYTLYVVLRYEYNQIGNLKYHKCPYPASELLRQEGFEECEEHVEYIGLVHNVVTFEPKWNAVLKHKSGKNGIVVRGA
jgi:hypothetical protein